MLERLTSRESAYPALFTVPRSGFCSLSILSTAYCLLSTLQRSAFRVLLVGSTPSQPRDRWHDREFRQILRLQSERLRILVWVRILRRLG
jgi:hypothetical protein